MTRVCVDKQTRTTSATKKYVDKGYLTWYEWPERGCGLWKSDQIGMKRGGTPMKTGYLAFIFGWGLDESKDGNGAEDRSRTDDLLITNQLLYQLSYFGFRCTDCSAGNVDPSILTWACPSLGLYCCPCSKTHLKNGKGSQSTIARCLTESWSSSRPISKT